MPSAKQIKARKAFVKKYAKKGKRSKSKSTVEYDKSGKMTSFGNPRKRMANPHGRTNFTLADYEKNEDINYHGENALELVKKYGTKAEIKKIEAINKRHHARGYLEHGDSQKRYLISDKYYKNLLADSKK